MNILVTGGAGYIGSHACKALHAAGFTPVVYDNLIYGHRSAVRWGPLEVGDIADRKRLDAVCEHYQPQAVMHFAAFAYVGESMLDPAKYYRNNVAGTLTLLEAMLANGIDQIIFSSSCATYGIPNNVPISEDSPQVPINPYGRSKLMIEQVLGDFERAHGLRSTTLRYFNAAGADPDGEIGESHDPETHLIPLVLDVAAGIRESVMVFGSDYDTRDGTCIRDYIHVSDIASAHVLALQALNDGRCSEAYNLGNGQGFSVQQVIAAVEAITEKNIPCVVSERRPGDPAALVGDASLIRSELGWNPQFSSLEKIIETAWKWHVHKRF